VPERIPLIYADTCVYLDLITRNTDPHKDDGEERWRGAVALFDAVEQRQARLVASPLIEAEVLCNGTAQSRRHRSDRVAERLRTWFTSPETLWVDIDRFAAQEAARLSELYGHLREGKRRFSAADALHLAVAVRSGSNYLMTHDDGFPVGETIEGVSVIRPRIVWQPTLFSDPLILSASDTAASIRPSVETFQDTRGLELVEVFCGPGGRGSAADQESGFDVLIDNGLGEVRAADQQHLAIGDRQLRVHLGRVFGPLRGWPVPYRIGRQKTTRSARDLHDLRAPTQLNWLDICRSESAFDRDLARAASESGHLMWRPAPSSLAASGRFC
jgi:predicted nucleic acid-binding protein